jgi:hypothetical protein
MELWSSVMVRPLISSRPGLETGATTTSDYDTTDQGAAGTESLHGGMCAPGAPRESRVVVPTAAVQVLFMHAIRAP